jgi:pilus assembly protein CpaC
VLSLATGISFAAAGAGGDRSSRPIDAPAKGAPVKKAGAPAKKTTWSSAKGAKTPAAWQKAKAPGWTATAPGWKPAGKGAVKPAAPQKTKKPVVIVREKPGGPPKVVTVPKAGWKPESKPAGWKPAGWKPAEWKPASAPGSASITKAAVKTAAAKIPARRVRWATAEFGAAVAPAASGMMPRVLRTIRVGESQVLDFVMISRAAVGNPAIADIAILSGDQLLVNGKTTGETTLFVWDRRGQTRFDINVVTETFGASAVADRVRRDIGNSRIRVRPIGDTVFLEGEVANQNESMRAEAIAAAYSRSVKNLILVETPEPEPAPPARTASQVMEEMSRALDGVPISMRVVNDTALAVSGNVSADVADRVRKVASTLGTGIHVLDMLAVGRAALRQTLVRTRVVEINKKKVKSLGVDWGRVHFESDANGTTTASVLDQPFLIGQTNLSPTNLFEGGPIQKLDPIGARISALVNQNAARILSEPNMFVLEGQKGSILIGGEIPIPVSQAAGIGTAISVDWKQFGIQLAVEPMVIEGDVVTLRVAPEVSALDFSNAVTASGITIPAVRSRRAESVINVRGGQTIALGGLLQNETANVVRRIPLLSKIPILGELFKSRQYVNGETELVILVTPEIIEPGGAPNVPVPDVELKRPTSDVKVRP